MSRKKPRDRELSNLTVQITATMRELGRGQPGLHPEIWARWREIVGDDVARRSSPRTFRAGVLTIAVASSTWMQELSFLKERLLARLAEEAGPMVVRDLKFVLDRSPARRKPAAVLEPAPARAAAPLPDEVRRAVDTIADPGLKDALARAAAASLDSRRDSKRKR
ncbi:MAG: DUF721 domain-containing protein [Deltaproteobacteria bacterium]|nr:DUF721 domain-containing protein [Deltaproteobacteria bacterium]